METRIYTDNRCPDTKIHNHGSRTFHISINNMDVDVFTMSYPTEKTPETWAQEIASKCFDEMVSQGDV